MSMVRATKFVWATTGLILALGARAAVPTRIGAINDEDRVVLSQGVSPRLAKAADLGAAPASQPLVSMSLRFAMTGAQQIDLTQLLTNLQNPASASYHQWLSPEQFGAQFGMASSDIAQVQNWLQSEGLTVTEVSHGGQFIRFSGTVAQAETAFHTKIDRVKLNGVAHIANTTAPSLPRSIAAVTTTLTGLNDFTMQPKHIKRIMSALSAAANANGFQPEYTSQLSGSHFLAPGDIYTIYDESGLISAGTNGSGVSIAVIGQSDVYPADLAAFRTASGLAANPPKVTVYGPDPGFPSGGDLEESELDLEWSGATAPSASIVFVTSTDVVDGSLTEAIDNNVAPVIADSYGECEADLGVSSLAYYNQLLEQGAAEGITMTGPAGDDGASDCDYDVSAASQGLAVDFPASSPYVTGVGGTTLNEGSGSYWSMTNGNYQGSALSYIPEVVWNDSSLGSLAAGGGGASLYFAKPSWQTGMGVPADFSRDVPDVALAASADHDPYLFCVQSYCVNGYYSASNYLAVVGGTSVSSPEFAGFMALVVQKQGRVGVANNTLYALANSTYAANVFHDITSGNNDSPCTAGSTNCVAGIPFGYTAGFGYDQASGLGSVDVGNLVNDWALVMPISTTPVGIDSSVTNVAGNTSKGTVGASIILTATVASGTTATTATPTGSVQFTVDSVAVGAAVTLAGGTVSYALNTTNLSAGIHTVQATYTGDTTFIGSKGAFTIDLTSATQPDFALTPATATVTTASGTVAPGVTFTVTPANGFTGAVNFVLTSTQADPYTWSWSANPVMVTGTSPVTTTLTLNALTPLTKGTIQQAKDTSSRTVWKNAGAGIAFAGLLALLVPRRRKFGALLMFVVAAGAFSLTGCANTSVPSVSETYSKTPTGTYVINVVAAGIVNGSAVMHTSTVTFVVQ
jgi:subtilase family serine protease